MRLPIREYMRRNLMWLFAAVAALVAFCLELRLQGGGASVSTHIDDLTEFVAALLAAAVGSWRAWRETPTGPKGPRSIIW